MELEQETTKEEMAPIIKKVTYGDWFLGVASFTESSFLPILIDPFILAMTLAKPEKWLRYAVVAGVTSVLGGLFGYFLGAVFFELLGAKLVAFYHMEDSFAKASETMNEGAFWFTLLGAFTPIPYKLTAIVGGVLHINILSFIIASIIGRFGRFLIVAYLCHKFGEYALARFSKRFALTTLALCGGIALYAVMLYMKS